MSFRLRPKATGLHNIRIEADKGARVMARTPGELSLMGLIAGPQIRYESRRRLSMNPPDQTLQSQKTRP